MDSRAAERAAIVSMAFACDIVPETGDSDDYPMAEICLLPDGMEGNTCAAFFLEENGYEICLRDEMSGIATTGGDSLMERLEEDR